MFFLCKICVTQFSLREDICFWFLASSLFVELPLFLNVEEGYPGTRFSRCPEGLWWGDGRWDIAPENRVKTCPKMNGSRGLCFPSILVSGGEFCSFQGGCLLPKVGLEHEGHPQAQRRAAEKKAEGLLKTRWKGERRWKKDRILLKNQMCESWKKAETYPRSDLKYSSSMNNRVTSGEVDLS